MNINLGSRRVLIYGDSLTYARVPEQSIRYDENTRWPCVLQRELGMQYEVIAEGLRARTLKGESIYTSDRDGYKQFGPIIASHFPLDLLILFLGTNDISCGRPPEKVAADLMSYFPLLRTWCENQNMPVPKVLIMAPPRVSDAYVSDRERPYYGGIEAKTRLLPELYEAVAREQGCLYFDVSTVVEPSREDGVHLDGPANIQLGRALASFIQTRGI
jgi:lysophospholipase L1-like esterase